MKKKYVWLLVAVALLALVYFALGNLLGSAVKAGVNAVGPKLTGTKVALDGAMISPVTGSGSLHGLFVGNPTGFVGDRAFYLGSVHVDIEPLSVIKDVLVIEEVVVRRPEFVYETKLTSSNLGVILENVKKATGSGEPAAADEGPGKKMIIRRFVLEDATVAVSLAGAKLPVPVPRLELTDIGAAKGGVTGAEAAVEVLQRVLAAVGRSAVDAIAQGGGLREKGGELLRKGTDAVKGLFDRAPKP